MGFQTDMDKTRDAVAQLTAWCVLVALHQDLGEGASKLNRVAAEMDVLQKANCSTMVLRGIKAAEEQRVEWLQGKASAEFPVPLLRAPRGRKEQQLRMAGNRAAGISWQICAAGCIRALRYGQTRLERLRQAAIENYRQFNGWAAEDGMDVAMDRLSRCVQDALKEEVRVVDTAQQQADKEWSEVKAAVMTAQKTALRVQMSNVLAQNAGAKVPGDRAAQIFERCMAETLRAGQPAWCRR